MANQKLSYNLAEKVDFMLDSDCGYSEELSSDEWMLMMKLIPVTDILSTSLMMVILKLKNILNR